MNRTCRLAVLAAAVLIGSPAFGVIVAGGTGAFNTTGDGIPGWEHVGVSSAGGGGCSAVYLGEGWVLTAFHVTGNTNAFVGTTVTLGGTAYTVNSATRLTDPYVTTTYTDLVMLKLDASLAWPNLPTLDIAQARTTAGTPITMIGNGRDRQDTPTYYFTTDTGEVDKDKNPIWTWEEVSSSDPYHFHGYKWAGSSSLRLRWGTNVVDGLHEFTTSSGKVIGFYAVFDSDAGPNEATVAAGDSGGGVFLNDGTLAGILTNGLSFQPGVPGSAAILNATGSFAVDLSLYRDQILTIAPELTPVPEPATLATLLAGTVIMTLRKRRV
jgi:hypothetical protein